MSGTEESTDVRPDPDRDAMYRAFEESPGDLAGYGAMADRLDELGYHALAHAYRWMQRRGKWPHRRTQYIDPVTRKPGRKVPKRFRWAWYAEQTWHEWVPAYPESKRSHHHLASLLMAAEQRVYPSHQAAVMDLAKWLQRLKDCYDLDPSWRKGL